MGESFFSLTIICAKECYKPGPGEASIQRVYMKQEFIMKITNRPEEKAKYDYSTLFLMAVLLVGASQAAESVQTPVGSFIRGVTIGMSMGCSLIGLMLYVQSQRKR